MLHLHMAGHVSPESYRDVRRSLRADARLVLTFQDIDHPDLPPPTRAESARVKDLVDRASRVTVLTREMAQTVRARYPAACPKLDVVGNGVGPEWSTTAGRGDWARRSQSREIVAVGRLSPYKGHDIVLLAFRSLAETRPEAKLTILGRDFQAGHYQKFAAALGLRRRVRFAGDAGPREVRAALRRARFVVSGSRRETYGMAVLEAMSMGAPIAATRTGVAAAILRNGRSALVSAPGDVAALAEAMSALWEDAGLRRRLGRAARALAADHGWNKRALLYARSYAKAIDG
ncbi:MAG: glycosyltransferase family 4 protein [Elusimicrobia bacterium]|nr:glycosyltransferase family 4 protein [Elusimicrobiota bacterium]